MNPNVDVHNFAGGRLGGVSRSQLSLPHSHKTTFNVGDLVPIDWIDILPGDTIDYTTNLLARLQTLITPVMDKMYIETWSFFVPYRIIFDKWLEFMGEQSSPFASVSNLQLPKLNCNAQGVTQYSLCDYIGVPPGKKTIINRLIINAYCKIYNDWFRDENLQEEVYFDKSINDLAFDSGSAYAGGELLKINKFHDYFTSALPSPQRGTAVPLNLDNVPVYASADKIDTLPNKYKNNLYFSHSSNNSNLNAYFKYFDTAHSTLRGSEGPSATGSGYDMFVSNLKADLSSSPYSIEDFRRAATMQQFMEKLAIGGSRYYETLYSMFGVTPDNSLLQRPELLAYSKNDILVHQIVQNSQTDSTPLGTTAAMSLTTASDGHFIKSFQEHGVILTLCAVRYSHSYTQGLNRSLQKYNLFDFYFPTFANLGNQPIYNSEIYLSGNSSVDSMIFGYQEAWSEYRYIPDRVSAEMRSDVPNSLDCWHLGDKYEVTPTLSHSWIKEDPLNVNRIIAVDDTNANQILLDTYFDVVATRVMPVNSVPGINKI